MSTTNKPKQCADCRNGEHENYDDNVKLVYVRDSRTKKIFRRSYMCQEHRAMYEIDGHEVTEIE